MSLKDFGIEIGFLISGLFGAILMVSNTSATNLKQTILSIVGGMASANYLTPVVIEMVNMGNTKLQNGLAFIIGFLGLKLVEVVSNKLLSKIDEDKKQVNGKVNKRHSQHRNHNKR
jgi:hypothetical protein